MTRITLTMFPGGLLRLHHDAGHTVTVLLAVATKDGDRQSVGPQAVKVVATNTETTIARVLPGPVPFRLESES